MVNEYLVKKDAEHLRRLQTQKEENGLEHVVRRPVPSLSLRQALLMAPEVQEHAVTCTNFGIANATLGGQSISFSSPDAVEQFFLGQVHRPSSSSESSFPSSDQSDLREHQQTHQQLRPSPAPDNNIYGTGKGIPMTCTCGQTIMATPQHISSGSYLSPSTFQSSSVGNSSYQGGAIPSEAAPLYGREPSSSASRGRRAYPS